MLEINYKENLDNRICDVIPDAENTQTFREFIRASEKAFKIEPVNLEKFNEETVKNYLFMLDDLWCK